MARRRRPPRAGAVSELPPLKILGQIASLQVCFYLALTVLYPFVCLIGGWPFSWDLVLSWDGVRGDTSRGWMIGFILMLVGGFFCGVIGMVLIVARSKLVLDFALTMHFLHLVVVYFYSGSMPRHTAWWISMSLSSFSAIFFGMYGCRWRELRPMAFGGRANGSGGNGSTGNGIGEPGILAAEEGVNPDVEQGYSRGRGRGKGRDGGGDYEMVSISQNRRED